MTAGRYLVGAALLAAIVLALGVGAARLRARLLPGWSGARARMVEALLVVAALTGVGQLLGAVGALSTGPFVAACIGTGLTAAALGRRSPARSSVAAEAVPPTGRLELGLAGVAVAALVTQWATRVSSTLHGGMTHLDTLGYHGPLAARFVQEEGVRNAHFTFSEPHATYFPAGSEVLHAEGVLLFGRDVLSPFLNFGWLALALLAAWSLGRPRAAGPGAVVGAAVALAAPITALSQAGDAKNDAAVVALLLVAAALVVADEGRASLALAGLAAGLTLGVKLTPAPVVAALTIAVVLASRRGSRRVDAVAWLVPLFAAGGFWYARNLVLTGNPIPWARIGVGPLELPSVDRPVLGRQDLSIADELGEPGFLPDVVLPGLGDTLGPAWPAVLALAVAGMVLALRGGPSRFRPALGAVGLFALLAYLFTPTTAGEGGTYFTTGVRYLVPALALGLALLAGAGRPGSRGRKAAVGALAVLLALTLLDGAAWTGGRWSALGIAATAAGLLLFASAVWLRAARPRAVPAAAGLLAALALAGGWGASDSYLDRRYRAEGPFDPALDRAFAWARDVRDARIATVLYAQYPLYGLDLSNRVQWPGRREDHGGYSRIEGCGDWRRALAAGRYRYVVTGPFPGEGGEPPEAGWTRTDRGAATVLDQGGVAVFRLDRPPDASGCR